MTMASLQRVVAPVVRQGASRSAVPNTPRALAAATSRSLVTATTFQKPSPTACSTTTRAFTQSSINGAPNPSMLGISSPGGPGQATTYFQKPSTPANTIIRFVPQQTAWIVERMGKFNRILEPGLAILIPLIDRIAYVKSLKELAIEIPSQSAITADNVTLELDGVLYTRVFDAYKARCATQVREECSFLLPTMY